MNKVDLYNGDQSPHSGDPRDGDEGDPSDHGVYIYNKDTTGWGEIQGGDPISSTVKGATKEDSKMSSESVHKDADLSPYSTREESGP